LAFGYIAILGLALLAPYAATFAGSKTVVKKSGDLDYIAIAAVIAAVFVTVGRGGVFFPLAPLLLLPFLNQGLRTLTGAATALMLFVPTLWWNSAPHALPYWQWAFFALLLAVMWWITRSSYFAERSDRSHAMTLSGAVLFIALATGWWTAAFAADFNAYTAWHHWGAYISPADLLLSGGIPYFDFPVQYGAGPTLLLAASCGNDCWSAMFYIVLIGNALYAAILCACAALLTIGMPRVMRILGIAGMLIAVLCWTAFPAAFGTAMATPSSTSLRFLPLALLLLFILQHERNTASSIIPGHAIWLLNAIWSVESAIFASVLWWPWLAMRSYRQADGAKKIIGILARYALTGGATLAAVIAALLGLFRLYFGIWPEGETVFAYFTNPPGPLPPNPFGPLAMVVILSLVALRRLFHDGAVDSGMLYACLLTMIAAFSYYLSRSHDNNILNLLPFVLLVAFAVVRPSQKTPQPRAFDVSFATLVPMATIMFLALFNYELWAKIARTGHLADAGPHIALQQFTPKQSDPDPLIPQDVAALIDIARRNSDRAPLFYREISVMPVAKAGHAWTSINNIANYSPLPDNLVRKYIGRGAARFNKTGWLIVEDGQYADWPKHFAIHYDVTPILRKGSYQAYVLSPKTDAAR
jgi:hypothetical protein